MAAGTPLSAKNAKVRFGATPTTLYHQSWEVDPSSELLDTTHSEGAGFGTQTHGIAQARVVVEGWVDVGANVRDSGFIEGGTLVDLKLYYQNTTGPVWDFPLFDVERLTETARVRDLIRYRMEGRSFGTYTDPTGNL